MKKPCLNQRIKEYALMLFGTLLTALAYSCFFIPYNIAPGGVGGLSVILCKYIPIKVGMMTFLLNLPIFMFALKKLGFRFICRTFVLMIIMSALIDRIPFTIELEDKLLSVVCGGILMGTGLGTVMRTGTSTGGTDTLAMALNKKYPNIKTSSALFLLDAAVAISAAFAYGISSAIYSVTAVVLQLVCTDFIFDGINASRAVYIITSDPEKMKSRLYLEANRGVTQIIAKGGFSGKETTMLLCIVAVRQLSTVKKCVKNTDPDAFMFDMRINEVIGNGFKAFEQSGV